MIVQPYLAFNGRAEEAARFYQQALGARIEVLMRFRDNPEPPPSQPADMADQVLHMSLKIGDSVVMGTDGGCHGPDDVGFKGISLSLTADTEAEARRYFDALADGGQVQMPLTPAFFSPLFGLVADRFGVSWTVVVAQQQPA